MPVYPGAFRDLHSLTLSFRAVKGSGPVRRLSASDSIAVIAPFPSCRFRGLREPLVERVGERRRGHHPERGVRPMLVVVLAPVLDQALRLGEAGEQLHSEHVLAVRIDSTGLQIYGCSVDTSPTDWSTQ